MSPASQVIQIRIWLTAHAKVRYAVICCTCVCLRKSAMDYGSVRSYRDFANEWRLWYYRNINLSRQIARQQSIAVSLHIFIKNTVHYTFV